MWGIMWIVGGRGESECGIFGGFGVFEGSRGLVVKTDFGHSRMRGAGAEEYWAVVEMCGVVEGFWTQLDIGCKCNMV
jgi:hypothetical protein